MSQTGQDDIPLGVLVIGRKRAGFDQEWNGIMRARAGEALAALRFASVGADKPVTDDQAIGAVMARIREANCETLLVLQPSIGNGQLMMTGAQHWPGPVVLWATPERADSQKVSSCSLVGQHMLASILRGIGRPFELVYGDPQDRTTREAVRDAITICRTYSALQKAKIGQIGGQPPGYLAMAADAFAMRQQLGVQLCPLSLPQFMDRVRDADPAAVKQDLEVVRKLRLPLLDVAEADLEVQSRYYLALRAVCDEERLDALVLQEWPEMPNIAGQWPYLAMSRLASEGTPVSMEGDVDAAVTCLIAERLGAGAGFITDWLEHDDQTIGFWHPGTAPLSLLESPSLSKHFNINKPMVVDGSLRSDQPVTITRLWRCDGAYWMAAFEGRTIPPRRKLTGNTTWVQIEGGGVNRLFDTLCHAGMPHHPILLEGQRTEALRRLSRMLNCRWLDL
jgi:L-fucose isomerase-like protein